MIEIKNLFGGYQKTLIIKDLTLTIEKGNFYALIGPNGSGKTTLIKLITGVLPNQGGTITLFDKPLHSYSTIDRAKNMAVLSQEAKVEFDFRVEEIVMLGRYPHQKGFLKHISYQDRRVVDNVMKQTDVFRFRKKPFKWLSGGEKQRVLLAKALAQEPKILFLDEPTNHLDIKHTVMMLQQLKEYQKMYQLTIVAILHDLNTAALFADKIGLLQKGKLVESGELSLLQNENQLSNVYEVALKTYEHPIIPKPQITVIPNQVDEDHARLEYDLNQTDHYIHLQFSHPLRTISNGVLGEGIQWSTNFCNFHVQNNYNCSNPRIDIISWLKQANICEHSTIGMMTAVNLKDVSIVEKEYEGIKILTVITAGVGNAVDITAKKSVDTGIQIGTVNIMVFIDAHLTDGALVNAVQSVTEAKTKAFVDLHIKDPVTQTIATGTSTDCTLVASTQKGEPTPYTGSGTVIGKGIGLSVYQALVDAIGKYESRRALL
ncbi:adenosylcobinamide amidohydrolase [Metabacillus sediminilitoris]|uniref:ATP-binding cassette domain-containing protein n=1 Tax=Metabacillus sediminilitoris TaxID=2567941 RepID=A0A4S4BX45_9BACI|nr:adenosylcobinamide amidohydrolase [Metabacillus sediminilitoris]QGQ46094.1 ATP-binding cassette domain-containing protein [Metabacillus sediminilitoris]THF79778.1 ATP-binding cassette domain-containing protein [Metabacillus sediminilitoris]